VARGSRNRQD